MELYIKNNVKVTNITTFPIQISMGDFKGAIVPGILNNYIYLYLSGTTDCILFLK